MSLYDIAASRRNSSLPLYAKLIGDDTCTATGITAPALALCRQLLAAGLDPDQALEVYRGATLALRIRSIGEGAPLTVRDDNRGTPRFVAYRRALMRGATARAGMPGPCVNPISPGVQHERAPLRCSR